MGVGERSSPLPGRGTQKEDSNRGILWALGVLAGRPSRRRIPAQDSRDLYGREGLWVVGFGG